LKNGTAFSTEFSVLGRKKTKMNTILGELGKSKKFVELIKNIEEKQSPIGISGVYKNYCA
jgi:hypothetical protein